MPDCDDTSEALFMAETDALELGPREMAADVETRALDVWLTDPERVETTLPDLAAEIEGLFDAEGNREALVLTVADTLELGRLEAAGEVETRALTV